jgi:hypothetical protein
MLGLSGSLKRIAALATVFKDTESADWIVSALDASGDGGIYVTVFSGPSARERATEYAREKYSGLQLREPDQPEYR